MNCWRAGLLALMLSGTAFAASPELASAPPVSAMLTPAQQAEAERISGNLRCPICTSQSITESGNDISREMRAEVARMVAEGQSEREIYNHFSARYGNFVLLDPPKEGAGLLLWLAPLLALGAGGYLLTRTLRNRAQAPATVSTAPANEARDDLTPYLAQVRAETMQAKTSRPETSAQATEQRQ